MIERIPHMHVQYSSKMRQLGFVHVTWSGEMLDQAKLLASAGDIYTAETGPTNIMIELWAKDELARAMDVIGTARPELKEGRSTLVPWW